MPAASVLLAFNQASFEDFLVGKPKIGDIGGAEAENVFEGASHFAKMKIHADAFEQFYERLRAHGLNGLRADAVVVQPMIGDDINGPGAGAMTVNVEETAGFGLGRGEPRCNTCTGRVCAHRVGVFTACPRFPFFGFGSSLNLA